MMGLLVDDRPCIYSSLLSFSLSLSLLRKPDKVNIPQDSARPVKG